MGSLVVLPQMVPEQELPATEVVDSVPELVVVSDVTDVVAELDVVADPSVVVSDPQEGARP